MLIIADLPGVLFFGPSQQGPFEVATFVEYLAFVDSHELVESSDHDQAEEEEQVVRVLSQRAEQVASPLGRRFHRPEQHHEQRCR